MIVRTMPGDVWSSNGRVGRLAECSYVGDAHRCFASGRMVRLETDAGRLKLIFLDGLKRVALRAVARQARCGEPGALVIRSDEKEMSDLMELIAAFGAEHGVVFSDPALEGA